MQRLETSKVKSFVSFCSPFCFLICSTKENIHDKNKETKCFIWLRYDFIWLYPLGQNCQETYLETQSKVYGRAIFANKVNDFQPLSFQKNSIIDVQVGSK